MSLTVTISAQQLSATVKGMLTTEQWDLMEQLLAEVTPRTTARALDWIGKNGCGYDDMAQECVAISDFIDRCYERFPSDHQEGLAIRAAIKATITENDKKDAQ